VASTSADYAEEAVQPASWLRNAGFSTRQVTVCFKIRAQQTVEMAAGLQTVDDQNKEVS
jgi:phosphohistidine phosphatase SixA